jgi:hypothetical protein
MPLHSSLRRLRTTGWARFLVGLLGVYCTGFGVIEGAAILDDACTQQDFSEAGFQKEKGAATSKLTRLEM